MITKREKTYLQPKLSTILFLKNFLRNVNDSMLLSSDSDPNADGTADKKNEDK